MIIIILATLVMIIIILATLVGIKIDVAVHVLVFQREHN